MKRGEGAESVHKKAYVRVNRTGQHSTKKSMRKHDSMNIY